MAEGDTYTTSIKDANKAGMKNLSATTFPSTTMVDDLRADVYSGIGEVIGYETADSNGVAKRIEGNKVKKAIMNIRKASLDPKTSADYDLNLTEAEINSLVNEFNPTLGFDMSTPGANQ